MNLNSLRIRGVVRPESSTTRPSRIEDTRTDSRSNRISGSGTGAETGSSAQPGTSRLGIALLADRLRIGPGEDGTERVWEIWNGLSERDKQEWIEQAKHEKHVLKENEPKTLECMALREPFITCEAVEENNDEIVHIPDHAREFVSDYRDLLLEVNPQLATSDVDRALVAMADGQQRWLELMERFPEAQIERHREIQMML